MRLFVYFDYFFLEWPTAVARRFAETGDNFSLSGLVGTIHRSDMDWIRTTSGAGSADLDFLEDLERRWIATPVSATDLNGLESDLGPGALRRIIASDRHLGIGFVSGAVFARSPLMELARDGEIVRRYVAGLVTYIGRRLDEAKPDAILCRMPDCAPLYVLWLLAHRRGIPFLGLTHCRLGDRQMLDDSGKGVLWPAWRAFERGLRDPHYLEEDVPAAREHLARFRADPHPPSYYSTTNMAQIEEFSVASILKRPVTKLKRFSRLFLRGEDHLRDWIALRYVIDRVMPDIRKQKALRDGTFAGKGQLPDRQFAFYPLHVEPEASTMVAAPMHTDQIAVIEALAKSLPLGMALVVKEHLPMLGRRPNGFYERLRRIPTVHLASPFESSLDLVQRADLTCVITGTAAWEALLLKKPALCIGETFFTPIAQGFVRCPDLSELPGAVHDALHTHPADDDRLIGFIAALLHTSFEMPSDLIWRNKELALSEACRPVVDDLCRRIKHAVKEHEARSDTAVSNEPDIRIKPVCHA
jgi:hypothetical protein